MKINSELFFPCFKVWPTLNQLLSKEALMNNLIKIAVIFAFAAVACGNLPKILGQVRKAQIQLIMESKASKWPKAMTLPEQ